MLEAKPWLVGREHLETERVSVGEFVSEPQYLGLGNSVFPEIVRTLEAVLCGGYDEAVLCWGIGSGKSFLAALALCYMGYSLLCLRDPQRSLGMAAGSNITLLTMAPSHRQAREVVFAEVAKRIRTSQWFQKHAAAAQHRVSEVRLPKGICIVAGNSSTTFPLGYNVLGAVIDEAAWFPLTDDRRQETVCEIYDVLKRRIRSRFLSRGLVVITSSPRVTDGFLERQLELARRDPQVFGSRRAVWEVRPKEFYAGGRFVHEGIEIPVEYRRDFELNPLRALRDLAARPTVAVDPFFSDPSALEAGVEETRAHPFDGSGRLHPWFRPSSELPRYVHVDLGLTRDACGMAMAYCESEADRRGSPKVVVELMHQIAAPPGGEVELSRPREIILALRNRGFNIAQVSYDGWQSADSRQILRRKGIRTRTVSVDRSLEAYETLKELILDGRLALYRYEQFLSEAKRLELVRGVKVDHPPGGSKDVADAVAGAVSEAVRNWGNTGLRAQVI